MPANAVSCPGASSVSERFKLTFAFCGRLEVVMKKRVLLSGKPGGGFGVRKEIKRKNRKNFHLLPFYHFWATGVNQNLLEKDKNILPFILPEPLRELESSQGRVVND